MDLQFRNEVYGFRQMRENIYFLADDTTFSYIRTCVQDYRVIHASSS